MTVTHIKDKKQSRYFDEIFKLGRKLHEEHLVNFGVVPNQHLDPLFRLFHIISRIARVFHAPETKRGELVIDENPSLKWLWNRCLHYLQLSVICCMSGQSRLRCKPNKFNGPLELCLSFWNIYLNTLTALWPISKAFLQRNHIDDSAKVGEIARCPSVKKPLPKPILAKINDVKCRH